MMIRQRLPFARISEGRGMKNVELYGRVRYAVQIEGLSERAAARRFGIDPRTVSKMMKFSVPPAFQPNRPWVTLAVRLPCESHGMSLKMARPNGF